MSNKKAFLLILDGWGYGADPKADAIAAANTPIFDQLRASNPGSTLTTFGEDVGLPEGQMGNSEVGHLNIGAGRIVWQELARINKSVREGEFFENPVLKAAFSTAKQRNCAVHFLGLVSDGGVHSHIEHLKALATFAQKEGIARSYVHAFTDGRDCDPKSGASFIEDLLEHLSTLPTKLASVTGRYYAMDRDKRWERVKIAYDALVLGTGARVTDFPRAIRAAYDSGTTDEFLMPMIASGADGKPLATIQPDDVVICFNFRTDRLRELTTVLHQTDMPDFGMKIMPLYYVTMTRYDERYQGVQVAFEKDDVAMTLGEYLEKQRKTQLRIAETEKYPHVTFFFSGGRENPFKGEERIVVPSPKVATYDLQPEMSAVAITDAVIENIQTKAPDFICLNFANTDMVGHTGVFSAAMRAAETVDACLGRIVPVAQAAGYSLLIIADHGNSDFLINPDGSPNTAHTTNPVPCIAVFNEKNGIKRLKKGKLADVAPTLLAMMGMRKPKEMTGKKLW